MLMGTYNHSLDAKGRLIIPARIREDLGTGFVITRNPDRCLSVYPMEEWLKLKTAMEALPKLSSEPVRRLRRLLFSGASQPEPDKQGRILIPSDMRQYASLTRDVTLIGVDDHVEIWDAETWNSYNETLDLTEVANGLDGFVL